MTEYWFRPKRYGYGATPSAWQGWVVTLGTVLVMVAGSLALRLIEKHGWALAVMFAFDAAALFTLFVVCRSKTDGEWRWRWGSR